MKAVVIDGAGNAAQERKLLDDNNARKMLGDLSRSDAEEELEVLQAWTPTVAPWKISKAGRFFLLVKFSNVKI